MPRKKKEETKAEPKPKRTTKKKTTLQPVAKEGTLITLCLYENLPEVNEEPVLKTQHRATSDYELFYSPSFMFEGIVRYAYELVFNYDLDFSYLTCQVGDEKPEIYKIVVKIVEDDDEYTDTFESYEWNFVHVRDTE